MENLAHRAAQEAWVCDCGQTTVTEAKPTWCRLDTRFCGLYVLIPVRP